MVPSFSDTQFRCYCKKCFGQQLLHPRTARQHATIFDLMPRMNFLEVAPRQHVAQTLPFSENLPQFLDNSLSIHIDEVEASAAQPVPLGLPITVTPLSVEPSTVIVMVMVHFNQTRQWNTVMTLLAILP